MSKLDSWNSLVEEVSVPGDIGVAIMTGRSELLCLVNREMSKEEVASVMNLIKVLMETNRELQAHSAELAQRLKNVGGTLKGLTTQLQACVDVSEFREEVLEGEEE